MKIFANYVPIINKYSHGLITKHNFITRIQKSKNLALQFWILKSKKHMVHLAKFIDHDIDILLTYTALFDSMQGVRG